MTKTTITDPSGGVTTVKSTSCCSGCGWVFVLALVVGLPLEAWQNTNLLGRAGIVLAVLAGIAALGYAIRRQSKINNAKAGKA